LLQKNLQISIIIAVYQRFDELNELLESLVQQTDADFEVVVVDDGSPEKLEYLAEKFKSNLNLKYFYKSNSGPAKSRNFGMERASGNYFIFLDSDTIAPKNYIETVRKELHTNYVDAFGGPDAADESFSALQKAISFSMTSFLTTGGIRGGKKHIGKFQPRSFNMGISRKAFEATGGFGNMRIGEDPDLSMTLWENGFETRLFPKAKVFHKRRTSLKKFAKQVYQFGVARPILNQRHPKYIKLTFWFPSLFIIGYIISIFLAFLPLFTPISHQDWFFLPLGFYIFYFILIFYFALIKTNSMLAARMAGYIVIIQFAAYGFGFLKSWIFLNIFRMKPEKAFRDIFKYDNCHF